MTDAIQLSSYRDRKRKDADRRGPSSAEGLRLLKAFAGVSEPAEHEKIIKMVEQAAAESGRRS